MQLKVDTPDLRSAVIFDHVEDAPLNGGSVKGNTQSRVCASIHRFGKILVTAARALTHSSTFVQVEGTASNGIIVEGGD